MISKAENICDLEQIVDSLLKKEQDYLAEIKLLKEQLKFFKNMVFSRKSEKETVEDKQLSLFEMPEELFPLAEKMNDEEPIIEVPAHKRKKRGRKPIPDNLPRVDALHDIPESEKLCECGCIKECIGQEVSEQLDIIPQKIQVIRHIRPQYACKSCEGVESNGPTVAIAPMPEQIIPKSIATPGLIAYVLVAKFVDALPFYRQEKQFLRIGVEISRASMCGWAQKVADALELLLDFLKKEILTGPLIQIDETPTQVLNEPNKKNTTKSYMWVFRGGPREKPGILFEYHASRSGDAAVAFLKGYHGVVQTDGYAGYGFLDTADGIEPMGCWAHVRRKFHDVVKALGSSQKGERKQGHADQALKYIRELYRIEKYAKEQNLTGGALVSVRRKKAKPILDEFETWLTCRREDVPPKSLLGKAVSYTSKQWHRLVTYIEYADVTLDNNMAENTIRPFAIGRKNWLFNASPKGAAASAAMYSLIETAKANGLEPYWYLRYIIEKIPDAMTEEDYLALLPQNLDQSQLAGPPVHY
jgi:transposase